MLTPPPMQTTDTPKFKNPGKYTASPCCGQVDSENKHQS